MVISPSTRRDGDKLLIVLVGILGYTSRDCFLKSSLVGTPFSPKHAPMLVSRYPGEETPEYWHLAQQDAFLLTPGVKYLLHGFLPEDDCPTIDQRRTFNLY